MFLRSSVFTPSLLRPGLFTKETAFEASDARAHVQMVLGVPFSWILSSRSSMWLHIATNRSKNNLPPISISVCMVPLHHSLSKSVSFVKEPGHTINSGNKENRMEIQCIFQLTSHQLQPECFLQHVGWKSAASTAAFFWVLSFVRKRNSNHSQLFFPFNHLRPGCIWLQSPYFINASNPTLVFRSRWYIGTGRFFFCFNLPPSSHPILPLFSKAYDALFERVVRKPTGSGRGIKENVWDVLLTRLLIVFFHVTTNVFKLKTSVCAWLFCDVFSTHVPYNETISFPMFWCEGRDLVADGSEGKLVF